MKHVVLNCGCKPMQPQGQYPYLVKIEDREWSLNDVLQKLADAESKSGFLCGFVNLVVSDESEKNELLHYLVQQDLIVLNDNESFKLSSNGEKRSSTPLPPQIESELR